MSSAVLSKCAIVPALGLLMSSSVAYSLGVGGVDTKSYIGQPLLVEIPLYNVESPNTLQLELVRVNGDQSDDLVAELSRANSQLSVLIRSQSVVNEPYFNFSLNLIDQGNEFNKQFTVLLDLSPTDSRSSIYQGSVPAPFTNSQRVSQVPQVRETRTSNLAPAGLMGPYDWAKSGAIPEKFGAVLDGQSLWRVARRISPAMNVTNNQMMWALFEANPQAFSTGTIESLRAGVYLNIPDTAQVAAVSDSEAKSRLTSLSDTLGRQANNTRQTNQTNDGAASEEQSGTSGSTETASESNTKKPVDNLADARDQFQLSGVDEQVSDSGQLVRAQDDESKKIINSLAETISSMTEQLGRKDKRIEVLEEQVSELKEFIQDGESVTFTAPIQQPSIQPSVQPVIATEELLAAPSKNAEPNKAISKYVWLSGLLGFVLLAAFLMRRRLKQLWDSLNFSGADDGMDFQASEMETPVKHEFDDLQVPDAPSQPKSTHELLSMEQPEIGSIAVSDPSDNSSINFTESDFADEEFSDLMLVDDAVEVAEESIGEEVVSFKQRFSQLLAEGKTDLAYQFLDIAHGNEIETDQYHYHRLQLLSLEADEEEFYNYYGTIEEDIPNFSSAMQTDISKLVVKLAQRHYDLG